MEPARPEIIFSNDPSTPLRSRPDNPPADRWLGRILPSALGDPHRFVGLLHLIVPVAGGRDEANRGSDAWFDLDEEAHLLYMLRSAGQREVTLEAQDLAAWAPGTSASPAPRNVYPADPSANCFAAAGRVPICAPLPLIPMEN